jgi:hypothetical protein
MTMSHIISIDMALFLLCVSILALKRTKSKKVLFTTLSFGVLLIIETLYLLQSSDIIGEFFIPYVGGELSHILLLLMVSLFAIGIIKVEKNKNHKLIK